MKKTARDNPCVVYKATNLINGKFYIGVTTRALARRKCEHFSAAGMGLGNGHFARAIRKHGRETFHFSVLMKCPTGSDGMANEIRLIAALSPHYNSTMGGESGGGYNLSEEGRRRIGDASRLRKPCLGRKATPEQRARLREIGLANKDVFKKYAAMGSATLARRVACLDDGLTFDSASAAARHYGAAKSAIIELCLGRRYRKTVNGRRFAYLTGDA